MLSLINNRGAAGRTSHKRRRRECPSFVACGRAIHFVPGSKRFSLRKAVPRDRSLWLEEKPRREGGASHVWLGHHDDI
jgi:hypothetical protein